MSYGGTDLGGWIRSQRERLGLTQQELADRVAEHAWIHDRRRVGVNPDMVSKWERGAKRPGRLYRRLLAEALGVPLESMREAAPNWSQTEQHSSVDSDWLAPPLMLAENPEALDLLLPQLLVMWRESELRRRELLGAVGVLPFGLTVGRLDAWSLGCTLSRSRMEGERTLSILESLIARVETAYYTEVPQPLLEVLRAVTATAEAFLGETTAPAVHRRLLRVVARSNLLAGRLSFFDVNRRFDARSYLDLAREAAEQVGDPLLQAAALGHLAFLPAAQYNFAAADRYIESARGALTLSPSSLVSAWLSAIESEFRSQARTERLAFSSIDRARGELERGSASALPGWFDFFDDRRLSGFEGYALRRAERLEAAAECLAISLEPGPELGAKQRAVVTLDLAVVDAATGDLDTACELAYSAALDLERTAYATASSRLNEFLTAVPDTGHPAVRLLQDKLAERMRS